MNRRKRLASFVGTRLIAAGVRLVRWAGDFIEEPEPEPEEDDTGETFPVEMDREALDMLEEGARPTYRRVPEPEPEPLEGSLSSRSARRESQRARG